MSVKKYAAFLKVIEKNSITLAAQELGNSQSAVTQLLNSLESELGVKLLSRSRAGIALTEEGKTLLPLIRKVYDADREVNDLAGKLRSGTGKTIRIASFTSVAVNLMPDIIRAFSEEEKDIEIELVDGGYNNIEEIIRKGQIDLAFVPLPLDFPCKSIALKKDPLLAVLPHDFDKSKLVERDNKLVCPVSLFANEPVVSLVSTIDRDAKTVFEQAGIRPNIKYRVEEDYAMLAMVEKGLGIGIVPELILSGNERKVLTVELEPSSYRTIGLAFVGAADMKPEVVRFAEFVKAAM